MKKNPCHPWKIPAMGQKDGKDRANEIIPSERPLKKKKGIDLPHPKII